MKIDTVRQFRRHVAQHKVSLKTDQLPYKNTWFLPILNLCKMRQLYVHRRGAITIVKYVPP